MKYIFYLLAFPITLSFISCKKEKVDNNQNNIGINKCKSFTIDSKTLTCCLDSVLADSRCPVNAVCIWEGITIARFKVSTANSNQRITLALRKFSSYNKDTTLAGFKIEFINLVPHGEANKPFNYSDYIAEIKVTRP